MLRERSLEDRIAVDSAGTADYHIGERPDPRTIRNASLNGVELPSRARQFGIADFEKFAYIIPMDSSNLGNIEYLERHSNANGYAIIKMRHFDDQGKDQDVPDPYYGGEQGFQEVFEILHRSCNNFLNYLVEKHRL